MELLCPSCQRRLTIPDQYAGQPMKCPMCNNAFTAPALAPVPGAATYTPPPPAPPPAPSGDALAAGAPPQAAPAPLPPPGDYIAHKSIWFSPRVLPWVVLGALLLVFILSFFPWDRTLGDAFGEHNSIISQSAWQAAFGSYSVYPAPADKEKKELPAELQTPGGVNILILFYVLLLILLLLVTAAAVVVDVIQAPLPPAVQQLLPWRWAAVAGLTALTFVLLVLQLLLGFRMENALARNVDYGVDKMLERSSKESDKEQAAAARTAARTFGHHRSTFLTLALLLHLAALLCSVPLFLGDPRRGRPIPRLDLAW
jgi:hypothetical protein